MSTPIAVMPVVSTESGVNTLKQSFFQFIVKEKSNRRLLYIALVGITVQFIVFKLAYPFADFFSDSYSYLFAAYANLDVSIWPIGYSKFLRVFHFITYSDTALIGFQYFFLELSALYFFYTILYFFSPVRSNRIILFVFLFFNPLFLYVSNYVNSDPLFIALSLCWFTQLIWIIHRPRLEQVFIQAVLLFACFTVRNNAYIYPFVTAIAFAFSQYRIWWKLIGAVLGVVLIIPFVVHTRNVAGKMTGTKQFSLFTGWQLANNALYAYEYMDTAKVLSKPLQELDLYSQQFYSAVPKDFRSEYLFTNPGNFFIQFSQSPLKAYLSRRYRFNSDYDAVIAWGKASAVFNEYGKYLIKHNKSAYFHEFMLPNAKNYFVPHLEKLKVYNLGDEKVDTIASKWFHYHGNKVWSASASAQGKILNIFPHLFLLINAYWIISILSFWYQEKFKTIYPIYNRYIVLTVAFFLLNFSFCVSATIIVMRYQVFPFIICVSSALLLTEFLNRKSISVPTIHKTAPYSFS